MKSEGSSQRGYSLVALVASITIMLALMGIALPSWRHVMKNEREEELVFRGGQIADAIARFQRKNGGGLPTSLDMLVKGKYLRKAYKDPMSPSGQWRLVRPGEPMPWMTRPGQSSAQGQQPGLGAGLTQPTGIGGGVEQKGMSWSTPGSQPQLQGPFLGVASTSTEKSLRRFNGREKYNEWVFMAGQPRMVGEFPAPGSAPLSGPGGVVAPGGGTPGGTQPGGGFPGGTQPGGTGTGPMQRPGRSGGF